MASILADSDSLEYIRSLTNYDMESILFDDALISTLPDKTDVGEFHVKVTRTNFGDIKDCIHVVASSQATIDDVPCGTTVKAFLTKELNTIRQEHTEYVKLPKNPLNRHILFQSEYSEYVITITTEEGKTSLGPQKIFFDDKEVEVWGIERQLIDNDKSALQVAWQSYYNIDG
ncbi:unnamed protein product [Didymodactylos carnosus]|uniref:Ciliogenesis-associated TTC17-interacting protein N-terminal domain-containing protein n=1 Tax=Didymodactylos carnosus TaxID=1234261 RepID=A0A814FBU8_9BILA|nr:unnamed protein product [Didymodactylos carnosus]CAF0977849.1 unnamed protein product [Didymodactylos carnosus]CAF3580834.1 unnamed protein product [Didymodactylos carnosus]CAF3750671.1 unnamed protein product [Didymodactylos carnosus]